MISRSLLTVFVSIAVITGLAYYNYEHQSLIFISFAALILSIFVYVYQNEIDYRFIKQRDLKLDDDDRKFLTKASTYYRSMSPSDKALLEHKIQLNLLNHDFIPIHEERPKRDEQILGVLPVSLLCLHKEIDHFKTHERIVLYRHLFPSPMNNKLHLCECDNVDGSYLLVVDALFKGSTDPKRYFDIGLYTVSQAMSKALGTAIITQIPDALRQQYLSKRGVEASYLLEYLGEKFLNPLGILTLYYFEFGEDLKARYPDLYAQYEALLN